MDDWVKKIVFFVILFIVLLLVIRYSFIFLTPFVFAALFAGIINPFVNYIEKKLQLDRTLAVVIVLVLFITVILLVIFVGISQIYIELDRLIHNLPEYNSLGDRIGWFIKQNNRLQELITNLDINPGIKEVLDNNLQLLYNSIKDGIIVLVNNLFKFVRKLPFIITLLFVSFIATFFMSRDIDIINEFIMGLFPRKWRIKIFNLEKNIINSAIGFIRAELILISITGFVAGTGLLIIGNQYALVIAMSAAILDLIPIIGPGLIILPLILYNIVSGNLVYGFKILTVYTIMAGIRQGIEGKIMGSNLGLHPLATMIALYAGYRIMGIIGFIIGPATLVLIKAFYKAGIFSDKI